MNEELRQAIERYNERYLEHLRHSLLREAERLDIGTLDPNFAIVLLDNAQATNSLSTVLSPFIRGGSASAETRLRALHWGWPPSADEAGREGRGTCRTNG